MTSRARSGAPRTPASPRPGDIRKRKKTLPVVWALEHASAADRARLIEIYAPASSATDGRGP